MERHRNAGVKRRIRVAADRERIAAQPRVLQDDVRQHGADQQNPQHKRHTQHIAFPQKRKLSRDLVHGQAVGDDQRQSANDAQRAQRHDERIDAQSRRQQAVDQVPRTRPSGCR